MHFIEIVESKAFVGIISTKWKKFNNKILLKVSIINIKGKQIINLKKIYLENNNISIFDILLLLTILKNNNYAINIYKNFFFEFNFLSIMIFLIFSTQLSAILLDICLK